MSNIAQPAAKVLFRIPKGDGTFETETIAATDLGGDRYLIATPAFWAYEVSMGDVVLAPFSVQDGLPEFMAVMSKAGNRTVRVVLEPPLGEGDDARRLVDGLAALGCSHHGTSRRYIAVNIPPDVVLEDVRRYLIEWDAIWEHADPKHSTLFPDVD